MLGIVSTKLAPAAIGPYSQAVRAGEFLFCSGQIPLREGEVVEGGIREQTECVLDNLRSVLRAGGADTDKVAKTTVYLANFGDFGAMNEVYERFFGSSPPARVCVEVSRLPRDVLVEIDAIAYLG